MLRWSNMRQTYNLIIQRDNQNSTNIAAAAKDDASAQRQLAIQMKNIALLTYTDSASMKTMTLINLCCLPGTLAAVRFPRPNYIVTVLTKLEDILQYWLLQLQLRQLFQHSIALDLVVRGDYSSVDWSSNLGLASYVWLVARPSRKRSSFH